MSWTSKNYKEQAPVKAYKQPLPYPSSAKLDKQAEDYKKFLKHIKSLQINMPFVEVVTQFPKYSKFLKELLTNRKKLEEASCVTLNENCSTVILNKLPNKMRDKRNLTLPCLFGNLSIVYTLAAFGESVNLMPYSFYKKPSLPEPKPIRMAVNLANKMVTFP